MIDANAMDVMEVVGSEVCHRTQRDALHEPLQCGVRFAGRWVVCRNGRARRHALFAATPALHW